MASDNYDSLRETVGRFKRAAIDLYIKEYFDKVKAKIKPKHVQFTRDAGSYRLAGTLPHARESQGDFDLSISRPGEDGEGGGEVLLWKKADGAFPEAPTDFSSEVEEIRVRIDDDIRPWFGFRDPSVSDAPIDALANACKLLATEGGNPGNSDAGTAVASGSIPPLVDSLNENFEKLQGDSFSVFQTKFVHRINPVTRGMWWMVRVLGTNMQGQRDMVEDARVAVGQIVAKSCEACETLSVPETGKGEVDWEVVLKIAACVVSAVGIFIPGGAAVAAIETGSLVLTTAADIAGDVDSSGGTVSEYENALSTFEQALIDLNTSLRTGEEAIVKNFADNSERIFGKVDRASFDLNFTPITSADIDGKTDSGSPDEYEVVNYDEYAGRKVYAILLPGIEEVISEAIGYVTDGPPDEICHHGEVALGASGPSRWFRNFMDFTVNHLCEFRSDIQAGAENFELVCKDIESTDQSISDELDRFAESIYTSDDASRADSGDGSPYAEQAS